MSFDKCMAAGGKVHTNKGPDDKFNLKKGQQLRVCIDKSGHIHRGHKRRTKSL